MSLVSFFLPILLENLIRTIIGYRYEIIFCFAGGFIIYSLIVFVMPNFNNDNYVHFWPNRPFVNCESFAIEKLEFLEKLEKEFEPVIKSGKQRKEFDWKYLEIFCNAHGSELNKLYLMRLFCEFTFKLFFHFNCEDQKLMKKIILVYNQVLEVYWHLDICEQCKIHHRPDHYESEDSMFKEISFSEVEIDEKYRFENRSFYYELIHCHDINYMGNFPFVMFCAKYGLNCSNDKAIELSVAERQLEGLYDIYEGLKEDEGLEVLCAKNDSVGSGLQRTNLRRITLISTAVYISFIGCFEEEWSGIVQRREDFNFHAMSLPEAEISLKDVETFLGLSYGNDADFINQALLCFQKVFPNAPRVSTPRCLKHLSRYSIRESIQKHPSITAAVSKLHLPAKLKDYLLYMSG